MKKCNCLKSLKTALQKERIKATQYAVTHPDPFSSKMGYSIADALLQVEVNLDIENIKLTPRDLGKFYYFIMWMIIITSSAAVGLGFHHLMGNWGLCFSFPIQIFMGIVFARIWFS